MHSFFVVPRRLLKYVTGQGGDYTVWLLLTRRLRAQFFQPWSSFFFVKLPHTRPKPINKPKSSFLRWGKINGIFGWASYFVFLTAFYGTFVCCALIWRLFKNSWNSPPFIKKITAFIIRENGCCILCTLCLLGSPLYSANNQLVE